MAKHFATVNYNYHKELPKSQDSIMKQMLDERQNENYFVQISGQGEDSQQ